MSEDREQKQIENGIDKDRMQFRTCNSTPLGFSLDYPWHWLLYPNNLNSFHHNTFVSLGTMTISMAGDPELGPDESSPRIFLMLERRVIEDISNFYTEYLSKQAEKTHVLWHHPSKLSSGENALEWSYEFSRDSQEFTAIATIAVKGVLIYTLIGSCLKSQFENMEQVFLTVVRSLSLHEPTLEWLTEKYFR